MAGLPYAELHMKNRNIAWTCLILSGLTEVGWAYTMKLSMGFTRLIPTIITVVILAAGFVLLERAVREFGIGMSYAVFTGIGVVGTTLEGVLFLNEGTGILKLVSLAVLVAGIVGLKLCDREESAE